MKTYVAGLDSGLADVDGKYFSHLQLDQNLTRVKLVKFCVRVFRTEEEAGVLKLKKMRLATLFNPHHFWEQILCDFVTDVHVSTCVCVGVRLYKFVNVRLSVVRCPLSVVRCPLSVVRCPLSVVRCPLSVVRCSLSVVRCPLSVVRCPLFVRPLSVVRCSLFVRPLSWLSGPLSVVNHLSFMINFKLLPV